MNKIDWLFLSKNPNIFEINKKQLKTDIEKLARNIDKIIHEGVLPTLLEVCPDSGRNSESKIQNFLPHE
jgi:hypothetical protein